MTVLVAGSFLAIAVRPTRAAPATMTLLVSLATWLVAAAAGLEWQLLGSRRCWRCNCPSCSSCRRARVRPVAWSGWRPLLLLAALGTVPWLLHAERMFASNRRNAGVLIGDVTMGVDHYAVQGALALALVTLSLLAACWPRGRRYLGTSVGLCAAYVGLVSFAFPAHLGRPQPALVRPGDDLGRGDGGPGDRRSPARAGRAPRPGRRGRASPGTARPCARP